MPGTSDRCGWGALPVDAVLSGLATCLALWLLSRAAPWTVDDAFIVARYADNWARHGVLSFNVDGPHVEGFTSPLFVAVACLAAASGVSAIAAMKAVGAGSYLLLAAAVLWLGRALGSHPLATGMVALAMVAIPEHVTHALGGLETETFVLASVLTAAAFVRAQSLSPRALRLFAACALGLALTRPEGLAMGAGLVVLVALRGKAVAGTERWRLARTLGLGFVLPVLGLTAARLAYFGSLLPNTFYAKRGILSARHASDLAELAGAYFLDAFWLGLALVALALAAGSRAERLTEREKSALGAASLGLALCLVAYARAELVMNYAHRFSVHALPWLLIPLLVVLSRAVRAVQELRASRPLVGWAAAAAVLVMLSFVLRASAVSAKQRTYRQAYAQVIERLHVPVARFIEQNTADDATVAVYPDAGFIPFATRRRVVDFGRLNDAHLARHAHTPADVVRYFFERAPEVAVLYIDEDGAAYDAGARALLASPELRERYRLVDTQGDPRGSTLRVYARVR